MEKNITEHVSLSESSISGGNMIRGVALFGSRISKNGYEYSDNAINDLVKLSEGVNAYINHPSHAENRERDGVRDLRDWAGKFSSIVREGDRVKGDFIVRESFVPLMKDIIKIDPGAGFSINAQVAMKREGRKEIVESVHKLRSVDLVASPATTRSLFEAVRNEGEEDKNSVIAQLVEGIKRQSRNKLDSKIRNTTDSGVIDEEMAEHVRRYRRFTR